MGGALNAIRRGEAEPMGGFKLHSDGLDHHLHMMGKSARSCRPCHAHCIAKVKSHLAPCLAVMAVLMGK